MGGSASSLFDGFPISLSNVKKFGSGIGDKFPSWNNIQSFGSSIGKQVGNIASKTGKALTSNKARGITEGVAIGVGKEIINNKIRSTITGQKSLTNRRIFKKPTFKGSKVNNLEIKKYRQPPQQQPQQQQPLEQQQGGNKKTPKKEKTPPKKEKKSSKK